MLIAKRLELARDPRDTSLGSTAMTVRVSTRVDREGFALSYHLQHTILSSRHLRKQGDLGLSGFDRPIYRTRKKIFFRMRVFRIHYQMRTRFSGGK